MIGDDFEYSQVIIIDKYSQMFIRRYGAHVPDKQSNQMCPTHSSGRHKYLDLLTYSSTSVSSASSHSVQGIAPTKRGNGVTASTSGNKLWLHGQEGARVMMSYFHYVKPDILKTILSWARNVNLHICGIAASQTHVYQDPDDCCCKCRRVNPHWQSNKTTKELVVRICPNTFLEGCQTKHKTKMCQGH